MDLPLPKNKTLYASVWRWVCSLYFRDIIMEFIRLAHKQGVNLAVGSHSYVPNSEYGWVYHRELELLQDCGMTPSEIIQAATCQNARFLKIEDQVGKRADLLLFNANPYAEISNMKAIEGNA